MTDRPAGASARGRRPLQLAHLTLLHVPPPRLVQLAAAAGYDGVSVHVAQDGANPIGSRYSLLGPGNAVLAETRQRLRDTGIAVHDIQPARLLPDTCIADFLPTLEVGAWLGARHLVTVSDDPDPGRNADRLAELAEAAAPFGVQPVLEFMAYSGVRTLRDADRLLDRAGHANLALMVDSLHWQRSGGTRADIERVAPARMPYLQLSDAPLEPPPDLAGLRHEARRDRLFPGEGGLPLADFLAAFDAGLPLSIETPVRMRRPDLPDEEIARLALAATRRLLAATFTVETPIPERS